MDNGIGDGECGVQYSYRKVARQREDWQWKLATELCTQFDTLCFETLNLGGATVRRWTL